MNRSTIHGVLVAIAVVLAVALPGCGGNSSVVESTRDGSVAESTPVVVPPVLNADVWKKEKAPVWAEVEKLEYEQKFQAALDLVIKAEKEAGESGNVPELIRCLIKRTSAHGSLNQWELAVNHLLASESTWPGDLVSQTVMGLYMSRLLISYKAFYGYEIASRDVRTDSDPHDIKTWSSRQITERALSQLFRIWSWRDTLKDLPVATVEEFVEQNNYPREIRGTLADTAAYMLADLLADSSSWSVEETNDVWRLDLSGLIRPAERTTKIEFSANTHPLTVLSAVLRDLEALKSSARSQEGALEARLTLIRLLNAHSSNNAKWQEGLIAALTERLEQERSVAWWTEGMYLLATIIRTQDLPDSLIKARATADACRKKFPDSEGNSRCKNLIDEIEAKEIHGLQAPLIDGQGKRSLAIDCRNLNHLWFRAWKPDYAKAAANTRIHSPEDEMAREFDMDFSQKKPDVTWDVDIKDPGDFRQHRQWNVPPLKADGAWVIQVSGKPDFAATDNDLDTLLMFLGGPIVVSEDSDEKDTVIFRALAGDTGRPLQGAVIKLYEMTWQRNKPPRRLLQTAETDANGEAQVKLNEQVNGRMVGYVDWNGQTTPVSVPYYGRSRGRGQNHEYVAEGLIFTDRSIYRPGQKVLFKILAFNSTDDDRKYEVDADSERNVSLLDANGEVVATTSVRTNAWGTASGEFEIPAEGKLLGPWTVSTGFGVDAGIRVEEYRIPSFSVEVANAEGLRMNKPARLSGTASYYFGLPVTTAKTVWKVERQMLWPWWWFMPQTRSPQIISSGSTRTDDKGGFQIDFVAEAGEQNGADDEFRPEYIFKVSVDITDDAGETHSATKSFHMGFVAVRATASADVRFFDVGRSASISLSRMDLNGNPAAGDISWQLVRIQEPAEPQLPADMDNPDTSKRMADGKVFEGDRRVGRFEPGYDPARMVRAWPDGQTTESGTVTTDKAGKATLTTGPLEPGFWRVRFRTTDQYGDVFKDSYDFNVAGSGSRTALPVLLSPQKSSYEVGEKLRLAIGSAFEGQYGLLQVFDGSGLRETRRISFGPRTEIIEYPIDKATRGGLTFLLSTYRDYQNLTLTARVDVPWSDRRIDVSVEHLRDRITPGGRETVSLRVSEPGRKSGIPSAEVLAWMYDKSLDDLSLLMPPDLFQIWPRYIAMTAKQDNLDHARQFYARHDGFERKTIMTVEYHGDSLKYLQNRWYGHWGSGGMVSAGIMKSDAAGAGRKRSMAAPASAEMMMEVDEESASDGRLEKKEKAAAEQAPADDKPAEGKDIRSAFAETAFFMPHLITGNDGSVTLEYDVPDSITTWKLLAYATTKDLRSGHTEGLSISAKDLMLKPFLPRFLREGDQSTISAVVANTTGTEMSGTVTVSIADPVSGEDIADQFALSSRKIPFVCPASGETTVKVQVTAPSRIAPAAFKISASAGNVADGELRSIPILPGRYHLVQSRFATLHNRANSEKTFRTLKFDEMKTVDPTRINDQMVVTVDGQLFMSVLSALPYLTEYPYECAEQTMNKFLSAGIMASLFDKYPGIAAMAKQASKRDTQFAAWNKPDPNRRMSLEETPWVAEASGKGNDSLLKILDPAVARAVRETAISKLKQMQHADGAFPWFPGGPPSQWVTLYIVSGMSRALEFKVDVPTDMLRRAMSWTHNWYVTEKARKFSYLKDDWSTATYLSWILSNLPPEYRGGFTDAERKELLDLAFANWKKMSAGMKAQLTLALHRAERAGDATLVWASVMDSAKREQDRGMFWAPEDRSWLWYNDTIEGHAQAIRTLEEIDPKSRDIDDLVLWLFMNKKLNHWKSTRATSEVIYSLAHYLSSHNEIGGTEVIEVKAAGQDTRFVFDPRKTNETTRQIVIEGSRLDDGTASEVVVSKQTPGWAMASATWHFSTEKLPAKSDGDLLSIERKYFLKKKTAAGPVLEPLTDAVAVVPGDEVEVQVQITSKAAMEYVHLRDPRPAGFEPMASVSQYHWEFGIIWYQEVRDSGENFFFERLPNGEYTFRYSVRAAFAGTFKAAPATIQPMYAPEFAAHSSGRLVVISEPQQ